MGETEAGEGEGNAEGQASGSCKQVCVWQGSWGGAERGGHWLAEKTLGVLEQPDPELVAISPMRELAIHLVSSTVVRACGSLPTSFTVSMRCREDLSSFTASSCRMLRKLRPFTSRIWSPTCQGHHKRSQQDCGRDAASH